MGSSSAISDLRPWLDAMAEREILVWGDLVADRFLHGTTTRVSREAPALVLRHEREEYRPGGAGNAAVNAAALGARVRMAAFVADDDAGSRVRGLLEEAGVDTRLLVERTDGPTPTKTRVMAGGVHTVRQQILRIDNDPPWPDEGAVILERIREQLDSADVLLVSDYGLGTVTAERLAGLLPAAGAARVPVVLDSRFALSDYPGVQYATPNEAEVEGALGIRLDGDEDRLERAGRTLLDRLECQGLVITRGSAGMAIFRPDQPTVLLPIHGTDEIADVTGAGDTVIASLSTALAAGADLLTGARLANVAAGLVVLKHGTATVSRAELDAALAES